MKHFVEMPDDGKYKCFWLATTSNVTQNGFLQINANEKQEDGRQKKI